jgi:hypothetical protein
MCSDKKKQFSFAWATQKQRTSERPCPRRADCIVEDIGIIRITLLSAIHCENDLMIAKIELP